MNFHLRYLAYSLLSSGLLILAWYPLPAWPLIFIGFVPLLQLQLETEKDGNQGWFAFYLFISLVTWNIGTTWWIWNASPEGSIAAFLINAFIMSVPWLLMHRFQKYIGRERAHALLLLSWIAFEYFHMNWDLSWPWLVLGNVFAPVPQAIQWYEYTGHLGGTIWVLWANVKIFRYTSDYKQSQRQLNFSKGFNLVFMLFVAPLFISWFVKSKYETTGRGIDIIVVQPNIDPYKDKFSGKHPAVQLADLLKLADSKMDSQVSLICFPETALVGGINEDAMQSETLIWMLKNWQKKYPQLSILSGADTYKIFPKEQKTITAREYNATHMYDAYNTAILITPDQQMDVYHKSKLVPGVEKMPYPQVFGFIEKLAVDLGGTSGSLGSDAKPKVFTIDNRTQLAPVICYESVYGEYVGRYVKDGAQLICILTNDGWWGNTAGYKQHFQYARLRAVETRRYVARSANTGISGFIDDKGNVLQQTAWWVPDALKETVYLNTVETFYVKYGDYIGWLLSILFALRLWQAIVSKRFLKRNL